MDDCCCSCCSLVSVYSRMWLWVQYLIGIGRGKFGSISFVWTFRDFVVLRPFRTQFVISTRRLCVHIHTLHTRLVQLFLLPPSTLGKCYCHCLPAPYRTMTCRVPCYCSCWISFVLLLLLLFLIFFSIRLLCFVLFYFVCSVCRLIFSAW